MKCCCPQWKMYEEAAAERPAANQVYVRKISCGVLRLVASVSMIEGLCMSRQPILQLKQAWLVRHVSHVDAWTPILQLMWRHPHRLCYLLKARLETHWVEAPAHSSLLDLPTRCLFCLCPARALPGFHTLAVYELGLRSPFSQHMPMHKCVPAVYISLMRLINAGSCCLQLPGHPALSGLTVVRHGRRSMSWQAWRLRPTSPLSSSRPCMATVQMHRCSRTGQAAMSAAGRPVPVVGLLQRLRQQAVLRSRQRGVQDQAPARLTSRQSRLQPQVCTLEMVLEPPCSRGFCGKSGSMSCCWVAQVISKAWVCI